MSVFSSVLFNCQCDSLWIFPTTTVLFFFRAGVLSFRIPPKKSRYRCALFTVCKKVISVLLLCNIYKFKTASHNVQTRRSC